MRNQSAPKVLAGVVREVNGGETGAIPWTQIVTAIVAALGFGLSLYNFIVGRLEKRPRLRVATGFGFTSKGEALYSITVANHGRVNVFVSQLYLDFGEVRMFFPELQGERPLQGKVEPGEAVSFFQETDSLHQKLREMGYAGLQTFSLIVEDSLSNRYRGDFKIDVGFY